MREETFDGFILVGGTALSLQIGHRKSEDIDLFTSAEYGSINWERLKAVLTEIFKYTSLNTIFPPSLGFSTFTGDSASECTKVDFYYTDPFIFPIEVVDNIRLASIQEIIAMKLDVISRGGRKKDFWDIHALIDRYTPAEMFSFFQMRYPYFDEISELKEMLHNFKRADEEWDPYCLLGKHWELIKLDLYEYFS